MKHNFRIHLECPGNLMLPYLLAGFSCGVCICPDTPIMDIALLLNATYLDAGALVDLVDILAVNPGIAGQSFDSSVLDKVKWLRAEHKVQHIMIDGGMDELTIIQAAQAGANVIVSGSSIFGKNRKASDGVEMVRDNIERLGNLLRQHGL